MLIVFVLRKGEQRESRKDLKQECYRFARLIKEYEAKKIDKCVLLKLKSDKIDSEIFNKLFILLILNSVT